MDFVLEMSVDYSVYSAAHLMKQKKNNIELTLIVNMRTELNSVFFTSSIFEVVESLYLFFANSSLFIEFFSSCKYIVKIITIFFLFNFKFVYINVNIN